MSPMTYLSEKVTSLVMEAVNSYGTYNPDEWMHSIEEKLTPKEFFTVSAFFEWVNKHHRTFGEHNIREVFAEFAKETPAIQMASPYRTYSMTVFDKNRPILSNASGYYLEEMPLMEKQIHGHLAKGHQVFVQMSPLRQIQFTQSEQTVTARTIDSSDTSIAQSFISGQIADDGISYTAYVKTSVVQSALSE